MILANPDAPVTVTCGGCDAELTTTHERWHGASVEPCPYCGAGADLEHARRHVDCPDCEENMDTILRAIRDRDPDGWESRAPTDADRDRFRADIIAEYGADVWRRYCTNWDD